MDLRNLLLSTALLAMLSGCGGRGDESGITTSSTAVGVDFLLFPNSHTNLAVADYVVEFTNTTFPTNPTTYTLTISFTDGSSQTYSGSWSANNQTVAQTISVDRAGGATISLNTSGATADLAIRTSGTTTDIASITGTINPSIDLSKHQIDQATYADEYYKAIDPTNDRDTLAKFKAINGFGATCSPTPSPLDPPTLPVEYEVRFRDVRDLGYGRHMCVRQSAAGDIAVWVENFQVTAVPGQQYGPLNLEAVATDDRRWHIGTNAIEFSAGPNSGATRFVKFYTYNPDGTRRTLVDLDGRGAKAMPVPCISCHGGRADPLLSVAQTVTGLVTSRFPIYANAVPAAERGNTLARMQPLNVDSLDFSDQSPYRRSDQEGFLKGINRIVLCSYPRLSSETSAEDLCRPSVGAFFDGPWPSLAANMIKRWYDSDNNGVGLEATTFSDTYVPDDWTDLNSGVSGSQSLYQTVVAPYCRTCHLLRGNSHMSEIAFNSYADFAGYADRIRYHVFDKGNMPLALLINEAFWESSAPSVLAAVPGVSATGSQPTRPIARPGPDRSINRTLNPSPKLSAAESVNASSYAWRVISGPCTFAVGEATKLRPELSTTGTGQCVVGLTVSNGTSSSAEAQLNIYINTTAPANVRFTDIKAILQGPPGCAACHTPAGGYGGIPVYYSDQVRTGSGTATDTANTHQFYLDIRARINFEDPEGSPLLRKPSGNHHAGGTILNISGLDPGDPSAARVYYDTFLNWILDGAPE